MSTWGVSDRPYELPTRRAWLDPRTASLALGVLCAAFACAFAIGSLTRSDGGAARAVSAPSAAAVSVGMAAHLTSVPPIGNLPSVHRQPQQASQPAPSTPTQSATSATPPPTAPVGAAAPSQPSPPPSSPAPVVTPTPTPTGGSAPRGERSEGGSSGRRTGGGSSERHAGGSFDSSG
ncbi:MAG TPA: hypothetical protein VGG98_00855 [Solirubrobacteraceae bacterium]